MELLRSQDFRIAACQATVYTPEAVSTVASVLAELAPAWRDRFGGEPQVVAHPSSPHPRVLLRSTTGMWQCEIAADRVDLYWIRTDPDLRAPTTTEFFTVAAQLLNDYAMVTGVRVGRLAAIANRVAPSASAGLLIARQLLRDELGVDTAESVELNLHHRRALGDFPVNAWMRCRTPDDPDPAGRRMVLVTQDLNTLGEHAAARSFAAAEVTDFFARAAGEHDRALAQFFP